jgi:transcriptional regulator with PAS, ATPase and Fis domain
MDNTTITHNARAGDKARPPWLVVLHSPDERFPEGRLIPLDRKFVLGREPGKGGLKVVDGAISRRHARFEWHQQHGLVELEDLKSKNGTFVNALVTVRKYLDLGDVVRAGDAIWGVVQGDEPSSPESSPALAAILGESASNRELKRRLCRAAPGELAVLLLGDTGTGKELAARAIHALSGRSGRFEALNCSAIPETLFESTFFGHCRGAFTGATEDSPGLLAACDTGTLFLDEIGELPPAAQPKLLRFLEDGTIRPVGGTRSRQVDTRIVAATNAPLRQMEEQGEFRSDLFARLESIVVEIPPLRERRGDILPLFRRFARDLGYANLLFECDAAEALLCSQWPRNIRELRSLVANLAQMVWPSATDGEQVVRARDLSPALRTPVESRGRAPAAPILKKQTRPTAEELAVALEKHDGNVLRVAEHFGRDRKQIYRWMGKYGLK